MTDTDGLRLLAIEMDRQCADGLATMERNAEIASRIATIVNEKGRLVLYGIGGSHYVNRMVEPLYREAGLDCRALSPSEALMAPLPDVHRAALFVSQSGESGEIVELLNMPAGNERRFGLTLNAGSTVDEACEATLIAHGGPENAFAATRSIILTIAMHATLLEQLGLPQERLRTVLANAMPTDLSAAHHALADCDVIVFSGRHVLQGAAQSAALSLMELARVPAIGLESGQFRHGPFEFLRPGVGVILLRSSGPDIDSIPPIADVCVKAGCTTLVLDASGQPLLSGMQIALPQNSGLAAATQMLLSLQHLNIATARRHLSENIGVPQFTSKVTI